MAVASAKWLVGNGSWYVGANWSSGSVPGGSVASDDTATIDALGNYTVKVGIAAVTTIGSVNLNAPGATLGVSLQGLAVKTALNLNSGRLLLQGALKGGSLVMNGGVIMRNDFAALDGVRVQGTLDMAAPYHFGALTLSNYGQLTLLNNTSFVAADGTSPGLLRVGGSAVTFGTSAQFDNASINFAAGFRTASSLNLGSAGDAIARTVTFGKSAVLDVASTVSVTLGGNGTLVNGGAITVEGTLIVSSLVNLTQATQPGTLTVQSGGTLVFAAPTIYGGAVTFTDSTAQLVFQGSGAVGATLQNFRGGDSIDLQGLPYSSNLAVSFSGGALHIDQGGVSVGNFKLTERPAAYNSSQFSLMDDGSGGTLLQTTHRLNLTAPEPPVIAGVSPDTGLSSSDGVTNTGAVTVRGTAEAGSQVALFDGAVQIGTATASTLGAWSVMPAMALSQSGHGLTARATDAAGNQSGASAAFSVTIDLTAPGQPVITGVSPDTGVLSSDGVAHTGAVTVSGTAEAGSQLALFDGAAQIGTATASTLGIWSVTPAMALSQGGHSFSARATDTAGNQSGASAAFAVTVDLVSPGAANFLLTDTTTGVSSTTAGEVYSGPVAGLQNQYINLTPDNLNVTATAPNSFIHTGSGSDAIDVSGVNGTNVLDGSTGSNFLVGGTGFDTFFVDDRVATSDIWSTVGGFHSGDAATLFGVTSTDFALDWEDNQGAAGYTGLTLHAIAPGKPIASMTLVGYNKADLDNGRLSVSFNDAAVGGSTYMYVHAI